MDASEQAPNPLPERSKVDTPDGLAQGSGRGLVVAIAVSFAAALLITSAPLVGLVSPATQPAFVSWPLLLSLAGLPPVLGVVFLRRRSHGLAAAVLFGPAVLVPGQFVLGLQFVVDPGLAARPALLLPHTLDPMHPSVGLWLLLAGYLAQAVAGVVAMRNRRFEPLFGSPFDASPRETAGMNRQGLLAVVLCVTVAAAVGLLMTRFTSYNVYLVAHDAVDSPPLVLVGNLLLAIAVPVMGGFVVSSADPDTVRGGLLGLAMGVGSVAALPVVAAMSRADLGIGWGPVMAVLAAVTLVGLAWLGGRSSETVSEDEELRLPGMTRLVTASGVLALCAGVLAVVGAMAPQLEMPVGMDAPSPYPVRMLWPAGLVLVTLGAGSVVPRLASLVRPVLAVAWTVIPLSAASVLDTVLTATQAAGARAGVGAWVVGLSLVSALASAILAALAGGVERDDVDLTEMTTRRALLVPALIAGAFAVGAFSLPTVTAPEYTPPGLFAEFGTTSWGLLLSLLSVLVAVLLAPLSRGPRAAALLMGSAFVVTVRVLELPLTAGRAANSSAGLGFWCGLASVMLLLVSAGIAASGKRSEQAHQPSPTEFA